MKVTKKNVMPSLDTETETANDNYKSYNWKFSMLWLPGDDYKQKSGDLPGTEHTLSLVISYGK